MADLTKRATLIVQFQNEIDAGAKSAAGSLGQMENKVKESAKQFNLLEDANKKLASGIKGGMALALAGIPAAAGAAALAVAKMGMDMQQTRVAFTTLTGSADEANKHLQDLRDFARSTPFQFTDLTQASKLMQAFGFATKDVIPMMRDIGDATSALGVGSEGIDRVVRALGQMQAKGKVSAEEMMQLSEIGISGWKYLAEGMGKTTAEVMKMSERGLVPAGDAIQYILKGMREDFGGGMAAQSKTAAGQLSNLGDSITEIGTTIGEIMVPALTEAITKIGEFVDTLKRGVQTADLVVNWQNKLDAAYEATAQKITANSKTYAEYKSALEGTAKAAGLTQQAYIVGQGAITIYNDKVKILTEQEWQVARGAENQAKVYGVLDAAMARTSKTTSDMTSATKGQTAAVDMSIAAINNAGDVNQRYAQTLGVSVESLKAQKIAIADTYSLAVTYTEAQKKQADAQKQLDDLNATIAARGPAQVAVLQNQKLSTEDLAKAQAGLKVAQEDLAGAQQKANETDSEFALRVETLKGKVSDYSATLGTHTGVVGGATKAELEQKKALEEQIATLQKADEVDKARGAFESLTKSFRDGILTQAQYEERAGALNSITGLYTPQALTAATAQETLMKSFSDPASEAWRSQLIKNKDAIDGQVKATEEAVTATDKLNAKQAEGAAAPTARGEKRAEAAEMPEDKGALSAAQRALDYNKSAEAQAKAAKASIEEVSLADEKASKEMKGRLDQVPASYQATGTAIEDMRARNATMTQEAIAASQARSTAQEAESRQMKGNVDIVAGAYDKIPKKIETEIVAKVVTQTEVKAQAGDSMEERREQAKKKAAANVDTVGEEARKTIAKTEEVSVAAARRIGETSETAKTKSTSLAQSVGNAMIDMARVAGQQIDIVGNWVNKLPTYKELVYQVIVKGAEDIPGGGGGGPGGGNVPEMAGGGTMMVPPGYPNDTYPIRVSSGERVTVQTPAQQAGSRKPVQQINNVTYVTNVYNPLAAAMLLDQQRRERIARSNARMGVG